MKIRVKVKNLLLVMLMISILYFWGVPQATLGIANYLESRNSDKAQLFYERYAESQKSMDARLYYAESLVNVSDKFTIYSQGWGGGSGTTPDKIHTARKLLLANLENKPSITEISDYIKSYEMLMDIAIASGDPKELRELILWGEKSSIAEVVEVSKLYSAFIDTINRDYESAEKIIAELEKSGSTDPRAQILRAEIALFEGEAKEAERIYSELSKIGWRSLKESYFGSNAYMDRNFWLESGREFIGTDGFIEGTILFEGKPMSFVEIYITEANGGFRTGGGGYIAITDETGYFKSIQLKKGLYDVGIGTLESNLTDKVFSREQPGFVEIGEGAVAVKFGFRDTIDILTPKAGANISEDTFTVSWEEVAGAAYYKVEPVVFSDPFNKGSGYWRSPIEDISGENKLKESTAVFRLSDFQYYYGGLSWEGMDRILGPSAVLGMFLPGIEYPITVSAYNVDNALITSSLPMSMYYDQLPSIQIPGDITQGQKLVIERKYPEAIEHYEKLLAKDPKNIEATSSLIKIYGLGWKEGEKNLERAIELSEALENDHLKAKLLGIIIQKMSKEEILHYESLVLKLISDMETIQSDDASYMEYKYHKAKSDWAKARESLEKLEGYVPDTLVLLDLYYEAYEDALLRLKDPNFYPSRLQGSIFTEAIQSLNEETPSYRDKEIFKVFIIRIIGEDAYQDRLQIYTEATQALKNKSYKTIIDELYNQWHWDVQY